jgi:hypothetical protein
LANTQQGLEGIPSTKGFKVPGPFYKSAKLLDTRTANGSGPWTDVAHLKYAGLHIFGSYTSVSISLFGSYSDVQPSTTEPGALIGTYSALTAEAIEAISVPLRWVYAQVTAISGTNAEVSATLYGTG